MAKPPRKPAARVVEAFHFATGQSSLGSVLLASSDKGVVAILIGDEVNQLHEELARCFPDAHFVEGGREAKARLASVIEHIESPTRQLDLPLDIRGTEFQRQVWEAVRRIPVGETSTYKQIASIVGAPKAVRAVGTACAKNLLAFAVPCHRVLSSSGAISEGYGRERKRTLLERESSPD